MEFFFFITTIVFLILWLTKKSSGGSSEAIDLNSKNYAQGYWDGVRATKKSGDTSLLDIVEQQDQQMVAAQPAVIVEQGPVLSEAEIKAKRNLKNINITLYVASFLLVSASALFVATVMPAPIRFMGIWLITIVFYAVGLSINKHIEKLKPASVAFVGTGLALLPFTGVAMYSSVVPDASICWFITSLIGLLAFIFAAIRLNSQVIAYFAIAFMISMASSSVAITGVGMIWYFVVLIVFGSLMTFIAKIRPNWVSRCFSEPIQQSSRWIVPLTLAASLFSAAALTARDYWIITMVCAIYYAAIAVSSETGRKSAIFVARLLGSLSILIMAYDFSQDWSVVGVSLTAIGVVQVLISSIFIQERSKGDINNESWLWIGFAAQLLAVLFLVGDYQLWANTITAQLSALLLISFGVAWYLRRSEISCFGTIALMILPSFIGNIVIKPELEDQFISIIFMSFAAIAVAALLSKKFVNSHPSIKLLLKFNLILFIVESLLFALGISSGYGFGIWLTASVLIYAFTYSERKPQISLFANALVLITMIWFVDLVSVTMEWKSLYISWIIFGLFYGCNLLLSMLSKKQYALYFWWSAIVVSGAIYLFNLINGDINIVVSAGLGLVLVSMFMVVKGWNVKQYGYIDVAAILSTVALQRILAVSIPNIDALVYAHWWFAVMVGLAYLYYRDGKRSSAKARVIVGLSIISFVCGMGALFASSFNGISYKLIFLIENIILLIVGLVSSRKLFTIWGAVCVALAVMWLLGGYTFFLLAFLGFILIGVAIYALIKQSKKVK